MTEENAQLLAALYFSVVTAKELDQILQQFQQALYAVDTNDLDALSLRQETLMAQLNQQQQRITQWFGVRKLIPSTAAIESLLNSWPTESTKQLHSLWQEWQDARQKCQQQLSTNARISMVSRKVLNRSLESFKGQGLPPNLYDQSGKLIGS